MVAAVEAAAAARLAKGGAELVEDLQQIEDDVELEHRLVTHHVVRLRHVDIVKQHRDRDHQQAAQQTALLQLQAVSSLLI